MKLKADFITQEVEGVQFLVPVGREAFRGLVRSNATAAFIVNCLKRETTEEEIVSALLEEYDVPRETAAGDVAEILKTLRSIRALEE